MASMSRDSKEGGVGGRFKSAEIVSIEYKCR